jgi:hypothetical protein
MPGVVQEPVQPAGPVPSRDFYSYRWEVKQKTFDRINRIYRINNQAGPGPGFCLVAGRPVGWAKA